MRSQLEKQLLFFSLLCILSKVCAQLCRTPCYCPWIPPPCPPGSPLVLDGCGCCRICARRLGEPCNHLSVCDQSQGLICDYSDAHLGRGGTCNFEEGDDSCEVNGKVYRDGEVFQPSCKILCRCSDGGVTCVPLCSEDVRLPTPDCPHPKRVEVPGKCCQEWICERQDSHFLQDAMPVTNCSQKIHTCNWDDQIASMKNQDGGGRGNTLPHPMDVNCNVNGDVFWIMNPDKNWQFQFCSCEFENKNVVIYLYSLY